MAGLPVVKIRPGVVSVAGVHYPAGAADLTPARLWIARGREWQGPFKGWRAARRALEALGGPCDALAIGRASDLGAYALAGGWRWRLAWGGDVPPGRYAGD
jgi:hypothetical protein